MDGEATDPPTQSAPAFRGAFEGALNPMLVLDDERRILGVNPAAEELFGHSAEELLAMRLDALAAAHVREEVAQLAQEILLDPGAASFEALTKDGRRISVQVNTTANFQPGRHLWIVVTSAEPADDADDGSGHASADALSERERHVLLLLADGATTGQIAFGLGIAETTTQSHTASIKRKLGATTRARMIALAARSGLITEVNRRERLYIHEAIRDEDGTLVDTRLRYVGHDTIKQQPEVAERLGQRVSAGYPNYRASHLFALIERTLPTPDEQEFTDLVFTPDWQSGGYLVSGRAVRLGNDRVLIASHTPLPG